VLGVGGFCLLLLIGFWIEKMSPLAPVKKAFLIKPYRRRWFLIGMFIVYVKFGTFDLAYQCLSGGIRYLYRSDFYDGRIGVFSGCVGKSAQFHYSFGFPMPWKGQTVPRYSCGYDGGSRIYLLAKTYLLLNTDALTVIAFIGAFTALMGALPAQLKQILKSTGIFYHFAN